MSVTTTTDDGYEVESNSDLTEADLKASLSMGEPEDAAPEPTEEAASGEGESEAASEDADATDESETDESEGEEPETEEPAPVKKALPAELQQYLDAIKDTTGKKPTKLQKRFATLIYRAEQAGQESTHLRAQLDQAMRQAPKPAKAAPPPDGKPVLEQFADQSDPYAAWQEAMVDWKIAERDRQQAQTAQQQAFQTQIQDFIADGHEDYFDVAGSAPAPQYQIVAEALVDAGPDVIYYLGQHPAEWSEINALPPAKALVRLGTVRATLNSSVTAPRPASAQASTRKTTKPIRPVGTSPVQTTPKLEDLPFEQYVEAANKLEREGRL